MRTHRHICAASSGLAAVLLCSHFAAAHGFAGDRFFPPTIATDDPFAVDELALPTISHVKNAAGDGPANRETDLGFEFDKEIFPRFAMGISDTFIYQKPAHGPSVHGWDNLTVTAKYEFWINPQHEAIISAGVEGDLGGTGEKSIGRSSFTTLTPKLYFGKGLGDLPDTMGALRPFAITGELGQSFPFSSKDPNTFNWGFAVEYSLPYLQQNVADIGLPHFVRDLIPLVEFNLSTDENRDSGGMTTGTVNPGILYESPYFQLGAEANIPINRQSGTYVGFTVQLWIFIDDIFPHAFGHPLFGGQP
jgi:hypothetical protein